MSLVGQSELLGLNYVVDVLVLAYGVLRSCIFALFCSLGENFGLQAWMICEQLCCIDSRDRVDRNVGSFVLEATMHVNAGVNAPHSCSESLNSAELVPFRGLSVIHLKSNIFANLVCSSANDHHQGSKEQSRVLISRRWSLTSLVRSLDPVPATITMTSETPGITQTSLVRSATTETDHHTGRTACLTESRRVIDSR